MKHMCGNNLLTGVDSSKEARELQFSTNWDSLLLEIFKENASFKTYE